MTLGAINGISIESILERIPDARLRAAYHQSLENLNSEHPAVLQSTDQLAHFLNNHADTRNFIDAQTLSENVASGRVHADEYVAAAYVLRSISIRSSISAGLFRINPLRAEHLILLQEQESSYGTLRRTSPQNRLEMLTALRDASGVGEGVLEYLRYFESLSPEIRATWSALETYQDHGTQTNFLDLRTRLEYPENIYRTHFATLEGFEVEELKAEQRVAVPQMCHEENIEPLCAPNDPSCEN